MLGGDLRQPAVTYLTHVTITGQRGDGAVAEDQGVEDQCAAAGLPAIRLHDLRHGCVSVLLALGVPPRTVMDIVGHSTLEMTVYGHVSLDTKRAALDQLGGLLDDEDSE